MSRPAGSKNKTKKHSTRMSKVVAKEPKHIPDNELELIGIIHQAFEGLSEEGKFRALAYFISKHYHYLPKEYQ